MLEKSLLAILGEPDNYDKYRNLIRKEQITPEVYGIITKGLDWWYKTYPGTPVSWEDLAEYYLLTHASGLTHDQRAVLSSVLDSPKTGATGPDIIRTLNERLYFDQIQIMAEDIAEGRGTYDPDEVQEKLDKFYSELRGVTKPKVITAGDILSHMVTGSGLDWRLEELNISVGPIDQGNLILVAARTEVGKTAFLVDQVVGFLDQVTDESPILYCTNEDPVYSIQTRFLQNVFEKTGVEIERDRTKYVDDFVARYGQRLLFCDNDNEGVRTWYDVVARAEAFSPSLIVIDQLRNLRGFEKSGTEVERLGNMFKAARQLAKDTCPIIVAHQADASAFGVMYPEAHQLEGTKTEVQGALDVQIMLGRSYESGHTNTRGLHIVKNKLGIGPKTDSSKRHGKFELILDEEMQHFKGVY